MSAIALLLALPSLIAPWVARAVDARYPASAEGPLTASLPEALLLYVVFPLAIVGATAAFLSPGVLLVAAFARTRALDQTLIWGTCVSVIGWAIISQIGDAVFGVLIGNGFRWLIWLTLLFTYLVCRRRVSRTAATLDWLEASDVRAQLATGLVALIVVSALLAPKLAWDDPTGDGGHMFETTRRLVVAGTPFWPEYAGRNLFSFPGLSTVAFLYPASWFMRLLGEWDLSVRVPLVAYLAPLVAGLTALSRASRERHLTWIDLALVWGAVGGYAITVAFNATYGSYNADVSLPAAQDTLFVVTLLAYLVAFVTDRPLLGFTALLLTLWGLPSGIMIAGIWFGTALFWRQVMPRRSFVVTIAGIAFFAATQWLAPRLLQLADLPLPGKEHAIPGLVKYFGILQFVDLKRVVYAALPAGIVPALACLYWRRLDGVSRALACLSIVYFLAFYFQAIPVLHYYIPAMLLPVAVLWRRVPEGAAALKWRLAIATGCVVAIAASWPATTRPIMYQRRVAASILMTVDGYETSEPRLFVEAEPLGLLFLDEDGTAPGRAGEDSYFPLLRHARRGAHVDSTINYALLSREAAPPAGFALFVGDSLSKLYVRSESTRVRDARLRPPVPSTARIYRIPRSEFSPWNALANPLNINMLPVFRALFGPSWDPREPRNAPRGK